MCRIEDCNRKLYKKTNECSYHRQIRLYGICSYPHKTIIPAYNLNGLCQQCNSRGTPLKIYTNSICLKCNKSKTQARGLCNGCLREENYGKCINGCDRYANDRRGYCSNCILRNFEKRKVKGRVHNSSTQKWCNRCEKILSIDQFYPQTLGGIKRAKYCKSCNSYTARIRKLGYNYSVENVLQTSMNLCVKCYSELDIWEVDHIVPRSLGGSDMVHNLQIMCIKCNRKKSNNESIDYRKFINKGEEQNSSL
jgi:5-methylcytosine-specific restriction endonuclease McrA